MTFFYIITASVINTARLDNKATVIRLFCIYDSAIAAAKPITAEYMLEVE